MPWFRTAIQFEIQAPSIQKAAAMMEELTDSANDHIDWTYIEPIIMQDPPNPQES